MIEHQAHEGRRTKQIVGLTYLLGIAGAAIAVTTLRDTVDRPSATVFLAALALACTSLFAAARQWLSLVRPAPAQQRAVLGALYRSQIAKYLPVGGFVQAAIQIAGDGADRGEAKRRARAFPLSVLLLVLASLLVGSLLVLEPSAPSWLRILSAIMPISLLVLTPAFFNRAAALLERLVPRIRGDLRLPRPGQLAAATSWSALNMAATSSAFYLLLRENTDVGYFGVVGAFALAWVGGFLVVPLPGGFGVREAILILALPTVPLGHLLAAAIGHRFVTIASEFTLLAGHQLLGLRSRLRH